MLRRVVVVGEVGRRGTVEVCFVRRLARYFIFFFFYPLSLLNGTGEKKKINGLEPSPHFHGALIFI